MKMWIARTKGGYLSLFDHKPVYDSLFDMWGIRWLCHDDDIDLGIRIDKDNYPEVTFENSPMEVELKLIEK